MHGMLKATLSYISVPPWVVSPEWNPETEDENSNDPDGS
jgi:hypothetical protein